MALVALRRHSICRAAQQSHAFISRIISSSFSSSQYRYELLERGQSFNVGSGVAECTKIEFPWVFSNGGCRSMSGIRSRVEKRMRRETGRTLREIRRAKKLRKKLMTEEERLIFGLRRAKKKVALLLQKLKKYELPELPPPRHDPEILTPEQLQALRKIGFKNKNYVPVGVRGVFGGVVQNMHMHWKFHETVQVCCDNFPKEKIREMATMLARLSGGIVIDIHNVKTIIMYRGRNYRQPKVLIPLNTLTKRKALFKARFEQALESQKINIKKSEQQLRRKGVNPEDPIAMASVEKVASTFFRAIDEKQGSPYMLHGDKEHKGPSHEIELQETQPPAEDSDQEELDRFIAEIEEAADEEWAAEEAAEKEERDRIRYWSRPTGSDEADGKDMVGRSMSDPRNIDSDMDSEEKDGGNKGFKDIDDIDRQGPRDKYDRSRRGYRAMLDRTRSSTDMVDNWNSDDDIDNDIGMEDDWDTEDDVSDKTRGQRNETNYDFDSEEERDYVDNREKDKVRSINSNFVNRSVRSQMRPSVRTQKGKDTDEDWDSDYEDWNIDDEVSNKRREEQSREDGHQHVVDYLADKTREYESDIDDNLNSDEEVDYDTESDDMVRHGETLSEEDVCRGRRHEMSGERDRDSKQKVVDIIKRKKQIDENWDSD